MRVKAIGFNCCESCCGQSSFYAASLCRTASLIIAAPFPAIMFVGALVLVEVTAGMTEASINRVCSFLRASTDESRRPINRAYDGP